MYAVQTHRVEDHAAHHVRVHVGRRAAVLKVPLLLRLRRAGDADGRTAVGDTVRERVHVRGFVLAGQPPLISLNFEQKRKQIFRQMKSEGNVARVFSLT